MIVEIVEISIDCVPIVPPRQPSLFRTVDRRGNHAYSRFVGGQWTVKAVPGRGIGQVIGIVPFCAIIRATLNYLGD